MPEESKIKIVVAPELEGGAYSNAQVVWHTAHEFTIDFLSMLPQQQTDEGTVTPGRVVARVKLAPTVVFDLIRTINVNMTKYEEKYGDIERPQAQPGEEGET